MDKSAKIKETVQSFVKNEKLFTSVDIGNAIKRETLSMDIRNKEVRDWLRANIGVDPILTDYVQETITVNNGANVATLYRPHWKDAADYTDTNQSALTPSDIDVLKDNAQPQISPIAIAVANQQGVPVNSPAVQVSPVTSNRKNDSHIDITDALDDGSQLDSQVKLVRENKYVRRIQIPGDITRALGWKPGQKVELDKIKIHSGKLNPNLKVWPDGRCSIPRDTVGYGRNPVKIILKDDAVYFEKA